MRYRDPGSDDAHASDVRALRRNKSRGSGFGTWYRYVRKPNDAVARLRGNFLNAGRRLGLGLLGWNLTTCRVCFFRVDMATWRRSLEPTAARRVVVHASCTVAGSDNTAAEEPGAVSA